jgi:hypothetical protein
MPREFSVAQPGIPDGVREPVRSVGRRLGFGFFCLNGADRIVKGRGRHWSSAGRTSAGTARRQTFGEAIRWRIHRMILDFTWGCPRVALEAFRPWAAAQGAYAYAPGDRLPVTAVRYAVLGCAALDDYTITWSLGLWAGDYHTDLTRACQVAAAEVVRWWEPRAGRVRIKGVADAAFRIGNARVYIDWRILGD